MIIFAYHHQQEQAVQLAGPELVEHIFAITSVILRLAMEIFIIAFPMELI
jgi:hypothetical protein